MVMAILPGRDTTRIESEKCYGVASTGLAMDDDVIDVRDIVLS